MIEVKQLSKSYGDRSAIDNLSFSVKKGEVVGFLGPNGAGKSTTMKIITGYLAPGSGSVAVGGFDIFESPIEVKRQIGYLPELPPVYGDMIVEDYLIFVASLKGCEKSRIPELVQRAIDKTNLHEVKDRLIQNLSKGFRQRVGIAQALVSDPEILILDEPTVGLDPKQVAEIRKLIQELKGDHTIVLSTHILTEVQATCERIIIINEGEIIAEDTIEGLASRMSSGKRVSVKLKNITGAKDKILNVSGVSNIQANANELIVSFDGGDSTVAEISKSVIDQGLLELRPMDIELEDIFIKLTSGEAGQ